MMVSDRREEGVRLDLAIKTYVLRSWRYRLAQA
jgi:hypothetical protein